jgi:hypothetical protein
MTVEDVPCLECGGSGACPRCGGSGGGEGPGVQCPECAGGGDCPHCDGAGTVQPDEGAGPGRQGGEG